MKHKKEVKMREMTAGSVAAPLILFALPLFFSSIFQQLYNTADLLFVGNLVGKTAAAAVGASSILVTCLIGLFTGISVGTGVAISQSIGAEKKDEADRLLHTAAAFSVAAGILLTIAGVVFSAGILKLLDTPENVMKDAVAYIRIYFLGMLPMVIYNIGAGVLRACGDSGTPFYILAAGGFLNVAADAFFIGVLGMGVRGAALATTVSQGFSAIAVVCVLVKGNGILKLQIRQIRIEKGPLKKILLLGIPAGLQSMIITLSNVVMQYYINGFGEDAVAAFATYFRLESFSYLPVLAFGQAATTFAGQNMGAGKYERIRKGAVIAGVISVASVAAIAFTLLALGPAAVGWFVKDEAVIAAGLEIIAVSFPFYWLNSLIEVLGGTLRGMGHSLASMLVILFSLCGSRIVLLYFLNSRFHTISALASVYPITWTLAVILLLIVLLRLMKRHRALER